MRNAIPTNQVLISAQTASISTSVVPACCRVIGLCVALLKAPVQQSYHVAKFPSCTGNTRRILNVDGFISSSPTQERKWPLKVGYLIVPESYTHSISSLRFFDVLLCSAVLDRRCDILNLRCVLFCFDSVLIWGVLFCHCALHWWHQTVHLVETVQLHGLH